MKTLPALRKKKGLSVVELSELLGCTRQHIYGLEKGGIPSIKVATKLQAIFNISLEEAFDA